MKTAHFQSFIDDSEPDAGPARLSALRKAISGAQLSGFLVPRSDVHQGEYVAKRDERLAWLTGFTGSAGFCAVLPDVAGVFVDGRYRVQVKVQTNAAFTPVDWPETSLPDWLHENLQTGTIGFDPWLHSWGEIKAHREALCENGIQLQPNANLIDQIWTDRPDPPNAQAYAYPDDYAGETHSDKRKRLAKILRDNAQDTAILTLPDSIVWLLNMRGSDVTHVPLVHSFAFLHADASVDLFIAPGKAEHLSGHFGAGIRIFSQDQFDAQLKQLQGKVRVDAGHIPYAVVDILQKAQIEIAFEADPVILPKACKNLIELQHARVSHQRDGAAMCEFLAWLDNAPIGTITEIDVVIALENFRRANSELLDISFDTISASGPNAALPHYRVNEASNRRLQSGEVMLVDSGGQYLDGTTDITRTIAIGTQPHEVCAAFTRVLQGMIAISRLKFPYGIAGRDLDAFARAPLWAAGQDFNHGTGHGVGHFLNVHEGPQRLSRASTVVLEPGMILSNEPGFYKEGAFGIRIENLLSVGVADLPEAANLTRLLEFETLTYVPIDLRMVISDWLDPSEKAWINAYHQKCWDLHQDQLSSSAAQWLGHATKAL